MTAEMKPTIVPIDDTPDEAPISVPKPTKSLMDMCKSTEDPTIAGVETLLTALPYLKLSEANDWARLHPNEATHWSSEYCFVSVPIKGQKKDTLHAIFEPIAKRWVPPKRIKRFRLALATKPHDRFFLCHVPSRNLDNIWNSDALEACLRAKSKWVQADSRASENAEGYQVNYARDQDAFPEPAWPKQPLGELIEITFKGRIIDSDDHPALLRLLGAKQSTE